MWNDVGRKPICGKADDVTTAAAAWRDMHDTDLSGKIGDDEVPVLPTGFDSRQQP